MARSLYAQVMGDDFARLDEVVRRFHSLQGRFEMDGHCVIDGPTSLPGRWFGRLIGIPVGHADEDFRFVLEADEHGECWTRRFPSMTMRSKMRVVRGELVERLGPVTFYFRLHAVGGALEMELARLTVLGVPWPRWWRPRVVARESESEGRFCFEVEASVPLLGRVTGYWGYLRVPGA